MCIHGVMLIKTAFTGSLYILLELEISASCYSTFVVGASSDLGQPFRPRQQQQQQQKKMLGLGKEQDISLRHSR